MFMILFTFFGGGGYTFLKCNVNVAVSGVFTQADFFNLAGSEVFP